MKQLLTIVMLFLCFICKAQTEGVPIFPIPTTNKTVQAYNDSVNILLAELRYYDSLKNYWKLISEYNIRGEWSYDSAKSNYANVERTYKNMLQEFDAMYALATQQVQQVSNEQEIEEPGFDALKPIADKWSKYKTGDGNCRFNLNIKSLQEFFTGKHTITMLEHSVCGWQVYGENFSEAYTWNEKTKRHDIPEFTVLYYCTQKVKGEYEPFSIYVTFDLKENITEISFFRVHEYDMEDHIFPQLKANGYTYNKTPSRFINTLEIELTGDAERSDHNAYYLNKSNGISVFVKYAGEKFYDVTMFAPDRKAKVNKIAKK